MATSNNQVPFFPITLPKNLLFCILISLSPNPAAAFVKVVCNPGEDKAISAESKNCNWPEIICAEKTAQIEFDCADISHFKLNTFEKLEHLKITTQKGLDFSNVNIPKGLKRLRISSKTLKKMPLNLKALGSIDVLTLNLEAANSSAGLLLPDQLKILEIENYKLNSLSLDLGNFPAIKVLKLKIFEATDILGLKFPPELRSLNIKGNKLKNLPPDILSSSTLDYLNIKEASNVRLNLAQLEMRKNPEAQIELELDQILGRSQALSNTAFNAKMEVSLNNESSARQLVRLGLEKKNLVFKYHGTFAVDTADTPTREEHKNTQGAEAKTHRLDFGNFMLKRKLSPPTKNEILLPLNEEHNFFNGVYELKPLTASNSPASLAEATGKALERIYHYTDEPENGVLEQDFSYLPKYYGWTFRGGSGSNYVFDHHRYQFDYVLSSSLLPHIATQFAKGIIFFLFSKNGAPIPGVSIFPDEHEILFKANTSFLVYRNFHQDDFKNLKADSNFSLFKKEILKDAENSVPVFSGLTEVLNKMVDEKEFQLVVAEEVEIHQQNLDGKVCLNLACAHNQALAECQKSALVLNQQEICQIYCEKSGLISTSFKCSWSTRRNSTVLNKNLLLHELLKNALK